MTSWSGGRERPGEPSWDSSFGPGRPGWHVECAAIATEYLGRTFDVQAGGSDLIFPHHEMSASHARVAFAAGPGVFARVYAHAGMVSYLGEKMSKSLGNLVFVNRLRADGVDPMAVRMALLAHHYRCDWEWTDAVLADGAARLARWRSALAHAEAAAPPGHPVGPDTDPPITGFSAPGAARPMRPTRCWRACARACATTSMPRARSPSSTAGPTGCSPTRRPGSRRTTPPAPGSSATP